MSWATAKSEDEARAVGLYAILSYDVTDFIDMLGEATDDVLSVLYVMLVTPNPDHGEATREINAIGASLVKGVMTRRKIPLETLDEMTLQVSEPESPENPPVHPPEPVVPPELPPSAVSTVTMPFWSTFGKTEGEISMACYVRACQLFGDWRPMSALDIQMWMQQPQVSKELRRYSVKDIREGFEGDLGDNMIAYGWARLVDGDYHVDVNAVLKRLREKGWLNADRLHN